MWVFCGDLADDIGYDTIFTCDTVDGFGDALFVGDDDSLGGDDFV